MLNTLKNFSFKQQFQPNFFGIFTNPFYFSRRGLFKAICKHSDLIVGKTLDIGCGQKPYQHLFKNATQYLGLEIDSPQNRLKKNADFFYDGKHMPFEDQSFDSLVCNEVLEHVFNPNDFLQEMHRILRGGGKMLITLPFVWDEHEQPYDYARYSSFGITHLLEQNGFKVLQFEKTNDGFEIIFALINAYIYKKLCTRSKILRILSTLFITSFFNLLGIIASKILPRNPDLYLDNVLIVQKQ